MTKLYLAVLTTLFNLSTMVLVILNMHQIVHGIFLVTDQQQHKVEAWWMVLQGRFFIADCLDLVVTLLPLCDEPSVCITLYIMYKLWLLFPLVVETNMQVGEVKMGKRWWAGLVIYCLMLVVNIFTSIQLIVMSRVEWVEKYIL